MSETPPRELEVKPELEENFQFESDHQKILVIRDAVVAIEQFLFSAGIDIDNEQIIPGKPGQKVLWHGSENAGSISDAVVLLHTRNDTVSLEEREVANSELLNDWEQIKEYLIDIARELVQLHKDTQHLSSALGTETKDELESNDLRLLWQDLRSETIIGLIRNVIDLFKRIEAADLIEKTEMDTVPVRELEAMLEEYRAHLPSLAR